jgi:adenine deaminase
MKAEVLAEELEKLKTAVVSIGCDFKDPLSTLSFMALEVIPEIKLTDRGLFDVTKFEYF